MPYTIKKKGDGYVLVRQDGSIKSHHATEEKAEKAKRIIMLKEHGKGFKTRKS